ncbi:MAG: hypothetical protein ABF634_02160, partial [Schleiferilactobacillus harbinensis]
GGNHTAALPLMWLGDLKTAVFAGFKRRHHVPAQFCRSLRSFGAALKDLVNNVHSQSDHC